MLEDEKLNYKYGLVFNPLFLCSILKFCVFSEYIRAFNHITFDTIQHSGLFGLFVVLLDSRSDFIPN